LLSRGLGLRCFPKQVLQQKWPSFYGNPSFSTICLLHLEPSGQASSANLGTLTACCLERKTRVTCSELHDKAHPNLIQLSKPATKGHSQHQTLEGRGRGRRRDLMGSWESNRKYNKAKMRKVDAETRRPQCIASHRARASPTPTALAPSKQLHCQVPTSQGRFSRNNYQVDFQLHEGDKVWHPGAEEELTAVPPVHLYINLYVFAPASGHSKCNTWSVFHLGKNSKEKRVHSLKGEEGMKGETEAANASGNAMFLPFLKPDVEQGGNKIKNLPCSHLILPALLTAASFAKPDLQRDKLNPPHRHWSSPRVC